MWLHHGVHHLEDMLNFYQTKWLAASLILPSIVEPLQVLCSQQKQPLWNLFICLFTLLIYEPFIKDYFTVIFNKHILHLLNNNPILLLKWQIFLTFFIFANKNVVSKFNNF